MTLRTWIWGLTVAVACGGGATTDPTPQAGANISVTVTTTLLPGATPDPDGYRVFVDSESRSVGANETVRFEGLAPGDRQVTLVGIAANCAVSCGRARTRGAVPGQTGSELFEVTCAPPPQGRIAFSSNRGGNGVEVYVVGADGSGLSRITHDAVPDRPNFNPRWSPDGMRIMFGRRTHPALVNPDIHLMNADGSGIVNLTDDLADETSAGYAWSPDGQKIVFASDRDDLDAAIYIMNADGSDVTMISNHPANDCCVDWSPDGETIAFEVETLSRDDVYLMDADGQNPRPLILGGEMPSWSPDGSTILYELGGALRTIRLDGSCETLLSVDGIHPTWSPDGFYIAFTGPDGVYIANFDGSSVRNLTGPSDAERHPSWTR